MDKGAQINDPAQRAKAWGAIDRQLTDTASAIPFDFDTPPNILSSNVQGVIAQWNASWDLPYMSLK
jgi:peptide/nickel transport system substrate-binding protein